MTSPSSNGCSCGQKSDEARPADYVRPERFFGIPVAVDNNMLPGMARIRVGPLPFNPNQRDQLRDAQGEADFVQKNLEECEKDITRFVRERNGLQANVEHLRMVNRNLKDQVERERNLSADRQGKLDSLRAKHKEEEAVQERLREELTQQRLDNDRLRKMTAANRLERERLEREVEDLRTKLRETDVENIEQAKKLLPKIGLDYTIFSGPFRYDWGERTTKPDDTGARTSRWLNGKLLASNRKRHSKVLHAEKALNELVEILCNPDFSGGDYINKTKKYAERVKQLLGDLDYYLQEAKEA